MTDAGGPEGAEPQGLPPFSVTMTVRDEAAGISIALDSILEQVPAEAELIVVDAQSTDGTWELVEKRAREDHRVIPLQAACNRGEGRNLAVARARSSIVVTHIDGDVRYAPGVLTPAARELASRPRWPMLWALGRSDPNPSSTKFMVWRKEALQSLGGYPATQRNEDIGLILRAFRRSVPVHRYPVPRVGDSLDPYERGTAPNYAPWMRFRHYFTGVDRLIAAGFSYPEYLRLLYVTRVSLSRFLAASVLGTARYLLHGRRVQRPGAGPASDRAAGGG